LIFNSLDFFLDVEGDFEIMAFFFKKKSHTKLPQDNKDVSP